MVGLPALPSSSDAQARAAPEPAVSYRKDPRGRKPKDKNFNPQPRKPISAELHEAPILRANPDAGKLNFCTGPFFSEGNSGWGANLDMIGLAHGPVGCGVFTQTSRLNLPGFVQGVESFTALHACTNLTSDDLEDGGDARLAHALDEAQELFPLARGITILSEDPMTLVDTNIKGIAKARTKDTGKLVVSSMLDSRWERSAAAGLQTAGSKRSTAPRKSTDVAVPFFREATGLVWMVSKLLADIGLNAVHQIAGSSRSDMGRIGQCGLVLGFAGQINVPDDFMPGGYARLAQKWFDVPLAWACFVSPSATDASLRSIAALFDSKTQRRAEQVIATNRKKIDAVIAHYRPRLQGKLVLHFEPMTDEQLEPYHLLGMRIGNTSGWTGKTGKWRVPRLVCDSDHLNEKAVDAYIAEAKPDLVLHFGRSEARGEYDWRKRGQNSLPFTPFFDRKGNAFWGYDGFAYFAATLDRTLNAPWRKILSPPWAKDGES